MPAQGVRTHPPEHAVVWRTGAGPTSSGRPELGDDLILHGSGRPDGLRIPVDELSSVEIGRGAAERINGDKSLVLERPSCERVLVAALGGGGPAQRAQGSIRAAPRRAGGAGMSCGCVPIRCGTAEAARQLVEEGPPFDVEPLGLERHHVFVSEREVVLYFEATAQRRPSTRSRRARVCSIIVRLFALHDVLPGHLLLACGIARSSSCRIGAPADEACGLEHVAPHTGLFSCARAAHE